MTDELGTMDATAQADLVRRGEVKPAELVEAAIRRIEARNPALNAVILPGFEKALEAARSPALPDGPLRGVPFLLKDLVCHTAGDPFYEGLRFARDLGWVEREDQHLAACFRRAGLVFLGRTNTPELGILPTTEPAIFGPTRNPWDRTRSAGGSSGGSAAAVASGMVPLAHANDGGGSIRIPASACGLVGLKPSRGRLSLGPDLGDAASGISTEGVLSRSVRDTALALDVMRALPAGEPYFAPPPARPYAEEVRPPERRLRIGLQTRAPGGSVTTHPECVAAAERAARLLEAAGHAVEPVHLAALDDPESIPSFVMRWASLCAWTLDWWRRRTGREVTEAGVEPTTWALAQTGRGVSAVQYLTAVEWHQAFTRRVAAFWAGGFDLLLTPTTAEPATPLGAFDPDPAQPLAALFRSTPLVAFTSPFNVTGQPAISLPLHRTPAGLPIGVQLVAPYAREDLLIQVAAQLEAMAPWSALRPEA